MFEVGKTMSSEMEIILYTGFFVSTLCAAIYGTHFVRRDSSVSRTILKTATIGILALVSGLLDGPLSLTLALAFSALGDAFLSRDGSKNFLRGLISFLIAHIAYIDLFWRSGEGLGMLMQGWLIPAVGAVICLSALDTLRRLWPRLMHMRYPVIVYAFAICLTGLSALTLPQMPMVIVGAMMFMTSDTILAHEEFYWPKTHAIKLYSPYAVWILYFAGQAFIAWSFLA